MILINSDVEYYRWNIPIAHKNILMMIAKYEMNISTNSLDSQNVKLPATKCKFISGFNFLKPI